MLIILKGHQTRAATDEKGKFLLDNIPAGRYTLVVSGTGMNLYEEELNLVANDTNRVIILASQVHQITGVAVLAKTENTTLREQAVRATVVDMSDSHGQATTLNEVLNRAPGVRIRQTGGLGAAADISVNGFRGKSVSYFINGVPADYLGNAFSLSSLPVQALRRVEIYKGVVPASLGADALGGAINLITADPTATKQLQAAYELASFNTHRMYASAFYADTARKWFTGFNAFFNHSDNNYTVQVMATDTFTRNQYPARVRLFHNAYTSIFGQVYAGVRHTRWTDELKFELSGFQNRTEQQHPALMTDPYGAVTSGQQAIVPALHYRKTFSRTGITAAYFLAGHIQLINRTDTAHGQYNWFGAFTPQPHRMGESRQPALSALTTNMVTSRTLIRWEWLAGHSLQLNHVYTGASRKGRDPLGPKFSNTDIDILSFRSTYQKSVTTAAWESNFRHETIQTMLAFKHYHYTASGIEAWRAQAVYDNNPTITSGNSFGIAMALKYTWRQRHLIRFSAEATNRLPDYEELFGNGIWIVPNFSLQPERSTNLNLGYRYARSGSYCIELNTFYRHTKDMILLVPVQSPYARYENQEKVRGFGVEIDGMVQPFRMLQLTANLTWQDLRLFGITSPTDRWKNNARLRNTPYFFGNAGISYQLSKLFGDHALVKTYLHYSFMRAFYLETIPKRMEADGFLGLTGHTNTTVNTQLIIPDQHLLTAGISCLFLAAGLTTAIEIKNIPDHNLYDNYRVQRAGRSVHIKLFYSLNTNNSKK